MSRRPLVGLVLAAGQGTRMRSSLPKPLHPLCGRPMLLHVLDALAAVPVRRVVVVVGHEAELVVKRVHEQAPPEVPVDFVEQRVRRGTGHAAVVGLTAFDPDELDEADVLVVPGDTPLLRGTTLADLVRAHRRDDAAVTLLTAVPPEPRGYGRVLRDRDGRVVRIVEEADATAEERAAHEVNTSVYCFRLGLLGPALRRLRPDNAAGEHYLTDVVAVLHDAGHRVDATVAADHREVAGVNDRVQLAGASLELRARVNHGWMAVGVTMTDPARTYVDVSVRLAPDVTLLPGTVLEGRTVVARGATVGPDTRLVDCVVGQDATVAHSVAVDAEVGSGAVVGPYAVLTGGTSVSSGARTGPFYTPRTDGGP
jgi:bifunctional UDP-N-acetylglucosamine pyrophosphorylase/glucosamine-1-phosphate N-acetyltransferase